MTVPYIELGYNDCDPTNMACPRATEEKSDYKYKGPGGSEVVAA